MLFSTTDTCTMTLKSIDIGTTLDHKICVHLLWTLDTFCTNSVGDKWWKYVHFKIVYLVLDEVIGSDNWWKIVLM